MINHTFPSYTATNPTLDINDSIKNTSLASVISFRTSWLVFVAAVFLVTVPVFIEAPLVRSLPTLSVVMTGFWIALSITLMSRPQTYLWGDILFGFSWTWLTGAIYWGWLRWEPIWHLPVEALGLPIALWCLAKNWGKVGNWFYLGSLFGTVLTDIYFYLVDLMPYWRQIMRTDPEGASQILQNALIQVQTPWGEGWAIILALMLTTVGIASLLNKQYHWYAFGGAVLSTILVDSLFLLAAALA
ncbi:MULTISPECIES: DUF3120 domain-containing protein [unclassified Anabaena]|uniref:DUF3120 domain-containing protein n=1 Tax=unclassified Anabaena TaxID=2619674 RepID=UPI001445F5B3|nr:MULTISPECIES: DUF3120 domain-containing protein [unclassified Anabaena]MTJ10038.1 DUF3120 domain-containing protein [Anabaena sp. UHCC 0204]MTJ53539.1 DUF3120 domain-containing protein [Anabaena sp. UHCC 0253]